MNKLTESEVEKIFDLCINTNMKRKDIAKFFNISKSSFSDIISGKTYKYIQRPANLRFYDKLENLPNLNGEQLDIIIGSLLGDGSIKIGTGNCCFQKTQCKANLEYLQWMHERLHPYSKPISKPRLTSKIIHDENRKIVGHSAKKIHISHEFSSISHKIFTDLEHKWYLRDSNENHIKNHLNHRIKCVPLDLEITPLSLAVWYLDDGSNNTANNTISLCTNGFTFDECENLKKILHKTFLIKSNIYKDGNGYRIIVHSRSYIDFINIIKAYINPISCFEYKIDVSKYKELKPYNRHEIIGVFKQFDKWCARITINNKNKYLGSYSNKDDAIKARKEAEKEIIASGNAPRQFLSYLK